MQPEPADVDAAADRSVATDAHHAQEAPWRGSLLLGSFVAAIAAAVAVVGPVLPVSGVGPGLLGLAADGSALFVVCSVFVAIALLAQWPIDDRLRRRPLPLWLFAVVRGVSLGVVMGAAVAVIASVAGLWLSAPQFFASGAIAGLWIGVIGALVGALLERSRPLRITAGAVVLVAGLAGVITVVLWRTIS